MAWAYSWQVLTQTSMGAKSSFFLGSPAQGAALNFSEMKIRLQSLQTFKNDSVTRRRRYLVLGLMAAGWIFGMTEALASIKLPEKSATDGLMCYQVQHEKIIESWFRTP